MQSQDNGSNTTKVTKYRTNYDADFKTTVVKYAIQNSNKAASDHFGINESNIRRWKRLSLKAELLESAMGRNLVKKTRVRRKTANRSKRRRKKVASIIQENLSDIDSMPLQQRLTNVGSATAPKEQEGIVPTLKSQPLSPTKLKVTRQSTGKLPQQKQQQQEEKPVEPVLQEVCLRWNTHHSNMQTAFPALLNKEQYCDVTLVAEGRSLKCHKLILSSCSSYFDEILEKVVPYQHPIIFLKDVPFNILKALCDFMYVGEVNIVQSDLDQILSVGESLKIKGLAYRPDGVKRNEIEDVQKTVTKSSRSRTRHTVIEENVQSEELEITDPLDLMEPTYEEAAIPDIPPTFKRNDHSRKSTGRRVRKRKHVEVDHEPSPPVFRMRKGTRSRPNVKVPRYFNANFDNSARAATPEPDQPEESYMDSFMTILEQIKTEPLDIEDNLISYEEESFNQDLEIEQPEEPEKVVKRRRLSRSASKAKVDPLKVEHTTGKRRRARRSQKLIDKSEVLSCNTDGVVNEANSDKLDGTIENSDRLDFTIENSGASEIVDEELRGFESTEGTTTVHEGLENVIQIEQVFDGVTEEGTSCEKETRDENVGYHDIRIENSYTDKGNDEEVDGEKKGSNVEEIEGLKDDDEVMEDVQNNVERNVDKNEGVSVTLSENVDESTNNLENVDKSEDVPVNHEGLVGQAQLDPFEELEVVEESDTNNQEIAENMNEIRNEEESNAKLVENIDEIRNEEESNAKIAENMGEEESNPKIAENMDEEESNPKVTENINEEESNPKIAENMDEEESNPKIAEDLDEIRNEEESNPKVTENMNEEESNPKVTENMNEEESNQKVTENINEEESNLKIAENMNEEESNPKFAENMNEEESNPVPENTNKELNTVLDESNDVDASKDVTMSENQDGNNTAS